MSAIELAQKKCVPCEGVTKPLSEVQIQGFLKGLSGWSYEKGVITKTFEFKNYYETTAFVNAVAWIAHTEEHHPEVSFGYKKCKVDYFTHVIKGISENDFICAAKIERLIDRTF